ncbi:MAG TPA: YggT family protein [Candidatus Paceibacterota bacterium]|nr:YggT family protein [Candidatus Paceibacterota bacterium]
MDSYHSPTTKPLFRGTQVVWYLCDLVEILLAFRFLLRLAGANPGAGFTSFIYVASWPFAVPFIAVFRATAVGDKVFEWTTLLAMIVYLIIAWGIAKLFTMSRTVSTPEAARKLDRERTS